MKKSNRGRILTAQDIKKNLQRIGREILKQNKSSDSLAFIGIHVRKGNHCSFACKQVCSRASYAQCGAGDQRNFSRNSSRSVFRNFFCKLHGLPTGQPSRGFSAVACIHVAGDVLRIVRGEECEERRNFFRLSVTAQRDLPVDLC